MGSRLRELGEEIPRHGPILFPSGFACLPGLCPCLLPSPMGMQSPSRPSTASTATPSTDLMGLEHGVWDHLGLGTTPWSPVPTLCTGTTIMQAEHSNLSFVLL